MFGKKIGCLDMQSLQSYVFLSIYLLFAKLCIPFVTTGDTDHFSNFSAVNFIVIPPKITAMRTK